MELVFLFDKFYKMTRSYILNEQQYNKLNNIDELKNLILSKKEDVENNENTLYEKEEKITQLKEDIKNIKNHIKLKNNEIKLLEKVLPENFNEFIGIKNELPIEIPEKNFNKEILMMLIAFIIFILSFIVFSFFRSLT